MSQSASYRKKWALDRSRGITRTVPADRVRSHIQALLSQGMSCGSIAAAAGLGPTCVYQLRAGQPTVRRTTAARLLAVTGPQSVSVIADDSGVFVPRFLVDRRIQALLALGWRHADMQARSGVQTACVMNQAGRWVTVRTFTRVAVMYEDLWDKPGPSARTRNRAARRGYAPPLAWDDIDDPNQTPDLGERPRPNQVVHLEDVEWVARTHTDDINLIAARLGVTRDAIDQARSRQQRREPA